MKKYIVLILALSLGLSSCHKSSSTDATAEMNIEARNYLYDAMYQYYFWYKLMPTVNKDDYKNPYDLLDAMMYKTLDKWSFVETYDEYVAEETGTFVGHGISMGLDADNNVRIAEIYNQSQLYLKGVRRGWIVKKLNGTDLSPIFIAGDATAYNKLIGASTAGVTNTFVFETPQGKDSTITVPKTTFITNTVLAADTFNLKSGVTGHLVFDQFFGTANTELKTAFQYFSTCNVTNLIVDLRYNGGGDLSILTNMASYIAGSGRTGNTFLYLSFNDLNTDQNVTYKFNTVSYPLNISKLVFITSHSTASASEDLINGLKAFYNVTCIGDTTVGKPVGMVGVQYHSDYMFWPIAFAVTNSNNEGDFYNGFPPDKYVADDITHDWSDRKEACLSQALNYLDNGNFTSKGVSFASQKRSVIFPEKPARRNNAFFILK